MRAAREAAGARAFRSAAWPLVAAAAAAFALASPSNGAPTPKPAPKASLPAVLNLTLPPPTVQFKDGPNLVTAQANCLVCHGADYVYNQPPLGRGQWTAEVAKMRNAYKAAISDEDAAKIVDYLMSQNGKT